MKPNDNGRMFEQTVLSALRSNRYVCEKNVNVGERPSGGHHKIDIVVLLPSRKKIIVSVK